MLRRMNNAKSDIMLENLVYVFPSDQVPALRLGTVKCEVRKMENIIVGPVTETRKKKRKIQSERNVLEAREEFVESDEIRFDTRAMNKWHILSISVIVARGRAR